MLIAFFVNGLDTEYPHYTTTILATSPVISMSTDIATRRRLKS
jgi:hypothetical protein